MDYWDYQMLANTYSDRANKLFQDAMKTTNTKEVLEFRLRALIMRDHSEVYEEMARKHKRMRA